MATLEMYVMISVRYVPLDTCISFVICKKCSAYPSNHTISITTTVSFMLVILIILSEVIEPFVISKNIGMQD